MLKPLKFALFATALLLVVAPVAEAQSGFALRGHYVYNSASPDRFKVDDVSAADGIGAGAEYVLPLGIGLAVDGYTAGSSFGSLSRREFTLLAQANYFLRLPVLPVSPYAGVHAGVGNVSWKNVEEGSVDPRLRDRTGSQIGYQFGIRFQPLGILGLDAQYRHLSRSAMEDQSPEFARSQIVLGITLF